MHTVLPLETAALVTNIMDVWVTVRRGTYGYMGYMGCMDIYIDIWVIWVIC